MIKIAGVIVNEVLCFIFSHYGPVPNNNISTIISSFFTDEECVHAKAMIWDVCAKTLNCLTLQNITGKGENKRWMDVENKLKFIVLLEKQVVFRCKNYSSYSFNRFECCWHVSPLKTVEKLHKKVDSFIDIKKQLHKLQIMVVVW